MLNDFCHIINPVSSPCSKTKQEIFLEILYEINNLKYFKNIEQSLTSIINLLNQTYSFNTVVLIQNQETNIREWHRHDLIEETILASKLKAIKSYSYMSGISSSKLAQLNLAKELLNTHTPEIDTFFNSTDTYTLILPLVIEKVFIGAIQFENSFPFSKSDIRFLNCIFDLLTNDIENTYVLQKQVNFYQLQIANHLEKAKFDIFKASVEAKNNLIQICGHELKTPISALLLYNQMAIKQIERTDNSIKDPKSILSIFKKTEYEIKKINTTFDNILTIGKMNQLNLELYFKPTNFSKFIRDNSIDFFISQYSVPRILYKINEGIFCNIDPKYMQLALYNLLSNAINYGNKSAIQISLKEKNNLVYLSIRDNGIGIAQHDFERIFFPYERAVPPKRFSGLGLGLYLVKKIVTAHSGVIDIKSKVGKGSNFIVTLPLNRKFKQIIKVIP